MSRPADVAAALAEAAKNIDHPSSVEETLDAIVHAARDTIPGLEHVGISILHRNGRIETKAGTDQIVWELDDLQYDINQGPCVDAVRSDPIMYLADARHDNRWPDYLPKAVEKGLRSQLALRLFNEDETLGGINMYSTTGCGLPPRRSSSPSCSLRTPPSRSAGSASSTSSPGGRLAAGHRYRCRDPHGALQDHRGPGFPVPRQDLEDQQPQGPSDRAGARRLQQRPLRTFRPVTSAPVREVDRAIGRISLCGPRRRERSPAGLRP